MSSDELFEEARKSFQKKDWKRAASYLVPLIEGYPSHTKAKKLLGPVFLAMGRANDSVAIYEALLEEDPTNANLIGMHGVSLVRAGQRDRGITELERSLEDEDNQEFRGHLYKAQGRTIIIFNFKERALKYGTGGTVIIDSLVIAFLESLVPYCIFFEKPMVKVSDLLNELHMDIERLKTYLPFVERNTGTKASFVQVDGLLVLEFRND